MHTEKWTPRRGQPSLVVLLPCLLLAGELPDLPQDLTHVARVHGLLQLDENVDGLAGDMKGNLSVMLGFDGPVS